MSFKHDSVRKNVFLRAFCCWGARFSLCEMNQIFIFCGIIDCGGSYLEFIIGCFKVFILLALVIDAATAVRSHSGKSSGYCNSLRRGPNSAWLGHLIGLLFFFYAKFFYLSIFSTFEFRSSMFCIVLDFEPADMSAIEELGFFNNGNFQGFLLRPPKQYKPTKQTLGCTRILHGTVWNTGFLDCCQVFNVRLRDVKCHYVAKGPNKCKVLGNLMDTDSENLIDHGCPKIRDFEETDEKSEFAPVTHSEPRTHFTVQSAKQMILETGQCSS